MSSSARAKKASGSHRDSRARAGHRRPLSAETITTAAIRIADADGLDAVSIRRVAAALDARPMSLYDHIPSKDELLSSMANEVVQEVLLEQPLSKDWRKALTAIAWRMYATFIAHPWLVLVFARRPRFGSSSVKQANQIAKAVESLSLDPDERWSIPGTVNDYVLGHSLRVAAAPRRSDLEDVIPEDDMEEFPELASLPDFLRSRSSLERFEFGLEIVLDGVERRVLGKG